MTQGCSECPVAIALRQRLDYVEERMERAEALLEPDAFRHPYDWALGRQEAVLARVLAKGPMTTERALAALEHHLPTPDGRGRNHVSVVLRRLRVKLADFGWVLAYADARLGGYRIRPDQQALFAAAVRGEGDPAHPSIVKSKKREDV